MVTRSEMVLGSLINKSLVIHLVKDYGAVVDEDIQGTTSDLRYRLGSSLIEVESGAMPALRRKKRLEYDPIVPFRRQKRTLTWCA